MKAKLKNIIYFFTLVIVISSCKHDENSVIKEISSVNGEWIKGETTYWIKTEEDNIWTEIQTHDTLKHSKVKQCNTSHLILNDSVAIEKSVLTNPLSKSKISETVEYSKKINKNLKMLLSLRYDYKSDNYFTYIIDSIGTEKKQHENKVKLDSIYKYAEKHGLYLCGTVVNEILYEDIPDFPVPREISLDSTLWIMNSWRKTNL